MAAFFPVFVVVLSVLDVCKAAVLPETYMTTPELIKYWKYPVETHEAVTSDGYILTLHRIPYGKINSTVSEKKQRPVFYLQHPLLSSSADWVINLPHQSLGFIAADQGFDVWMGNVRGNVYSKKHVSLKVGSKAFWDFSFDEHAKYDLPAMIHYILNRTGEAQLYYVGHSQGSVMALAGLSENQELQSKIKVQFALSPITRMRHTNKAITRIAYWEGKLAFFFRLFGIREIFPSDSKTKIFMSHLCYWFPSICKDIATILGGEDRKYLNQTRLPVYFSHIPAGTSAKNMLHYFQIVNSKLFRKYDYGEQGNLVHYKSKVPPEYNISKIRTPTVLISGSKDSIAPAVDVKWTLDHLTTVIKHFEIKDYNHLDFIWGINADKVLHKEIIYIARAAA